jgi:hypothetical protein
MGGEKGEHGGFGEGLKTNTEGLQTTKKWEADVHAKR